MRVLDCVQGSPEWITARLGKPTASRFGEILTEKTMKPSRSQDRYLHELVAEWLLGYPVNEDGQGFMARGSALEASAVAAYEFTHGVEVTRVGFCLSDNGLYGASPDGMVDPDGLAEFKVPGAARHVGYLLGDPMAHRAQTQGQLLVTGRAWVDLVSYHPNLPQTVVRCERDEEYLSALGVELRRFCMRLEEAKDGMRARGYGPPEDGAGGWLALQLRASLVTHG